MPKVVCIVQARTGSTRLPGKVLRELCGRPMLEHLLERLQRAVTLDEIVVATTVKEQDRPIVELAQRAGVGWFQGSEDDVLARYAGAARQAQADVVVRVTSDCPLIDPFIVDRTVNFFLANNYDYVGAGVDSGFPRGLDTEVFSAGALYKAFASAADAPSREHVTLYIYRHPEVFHLGRVSASGDYNHPEWRLCVDTEEDFELIREIYANLWQPGEIVDFRQVAALLQAKPALLYINVHVRQKQV